ncbi:MAG: hypothetical protein KDJ62_12860 [Rhodobiaceae bacterium]|nr:hypothetical protein [Rhodobiaceae bacterium]MCC0048644.1 MarR family transcriptional regulator [Rhodobiaceae bacterium]
MLPAHIRLRMVIDLFRELDESMPIQTALTFIVIAEASDRNAPVIAKDVEKELGLSNSSAVRNVQALTLTSWNGKPGADAVVQIPDPSDGRAKRLALTPRGRRIWERMKRALEKE